MKKLIAKAKLLPFLFVAALLCAAPDPASAQQAGPGGMSGMTSKSSATTAAEAHLMRKDKLVGQTIKSSQNEELGKISDLMVDPANGRVRYFILSSAGEEYPVPWQAIDFTHPEQQFTLDITADRLKQAPKGTEVTSRQQAQQIYNFYGIAPHWQEKAGGRKFKPGKMQ